jgi:hypothetical protein
MGAVCTSALLFLAADLQAQWIKQINFSPSEGYTNGPLLGQPAGDAAKAWISVSENKGESYILEDGTQHIALTVTNEAMMIRPDQNFGELKSVIYFAIPFPAQGKGPITVTWDWQFFPTNEIPADYDPTNNNYQAQLQGTDLGFTLSDSANRALGDNDWAVFNELSTPTRMGGVCDSRYNGFGDYGTCGGGGNWNDKGPQYRDGKKLHMKMVAYFGDDNDPQNNSYDVWAQREGEEVWHTTVNDLYPDGKFPMRRCPGEAGGEPKIDCITVWLNGGTYSTYILVDNIRVYGPSLEEPPPEPTSTGQPAELGQTVNGYQDDFAGPNRDPNWKVRGPGGDLYQQADGLLRVSVRSSDPNHLLYEAPGYSTNVQEVLARMRIVAFGVNADGPRAGVGVGVGTNSQGINLHFRNFTADNVPGRQFKLLDDARAWGPAGLKLDWETNVWYWLRLKQEKDAGGGVNDVFAKAWLADGKTPEPSDWQMSWNYIPARTERSGFAGITGSSIDGIGNFEVDYLLIKAAGLPSIKVAFPAEGPPPTPPAITGIGRPTLNQVSIEWVGAAELQSTASLVTGPWSAVANGATPYTTPPSGDAKFYRLKW